MLEALPNELLLTILQYLDLIHLIRAFHNLNNRFDQLLFVTIGNGHLDCRSLSKNDFEWFAQHHLASIDTRVTSWRFSDDLATPDFSQHYLSIGHPINRMQCLKSLSIDRIFSFERLNQITSQLRALPYFTHIRLAIENSQDRELHFRDFINHIWSLPALTHFDLDIIYPYSAWLLHISETSSSLLDLSLKHIDCHADTLANVFQHTPRLRRLSIGMFASFADQDAPRIFSPLLSLSITMNDHSSIQSMRNLFQQTPNVRYLTVRAKRLQLDGHRWQQILTSHFPSLKTFRLMMTVEFSWLDDAEEQVDLLLDSFRSDFWLNKHRLFVQCHWPPTGMDRTGLLYTLPYPSDTFDLIDGIRSKSTHPDQLDINAVPYDQVTHLHHTNRRRDFDENQLVSPFVFQRIRHLKINLPFDQSFWLQIRTLTHLTSLDVTLNQTFGYCQLQILLDRSPHMYSLRFSHLVPFSTDAFQITSASLRRLELVQDWNFNLHYFSAAECAAFARTSVAHQCEVLLIDLDDRTTILELIEMMPRLRALRVRCATDLQSSFSANNELIDWLRKHLPSTYTCSIDRNSYIPLINLWIGRDHYADIRTDSLFLSRSVSLVNRE